MLYHQCIDPPIIEGRNDPFSEAYKHIVTQSNKIEAIIEKKPDSWISPWTSKKYKFIDITKNSEIMAPLDAIYKWLYKITFASEENADRESSKAARDFFKGKESLMKKSLEKNLDQCARVVWNSSLDVDFGNVIVTKNNSSRT